MRNRSSSYLICSPGIVLTYDTKQQNIYKIEKEKIRKGWKLKESFEKEMEIYNENGDINCSTLKHYRLSLYFILNFFKSKIKFKFMSAITDNTIVFLRA